MGRMDEEEFAGVWKGVGKGNIINSDFLGFTEYQGPQRWVNPQDHSGEPYNLFVCNRCKEFKFWSRVYGEFPIIAPMVGIDPYMEARMIVELHSKHFCHSKEDEEREE
jgi:hypothetical protein